MSHPEELIEDYERIVGKDPLGHRRLILSGLNSAVDAVRPGVLMKSRLSIDANDNLRILGSELAFPLRSYDKLIVVGTGKASGAMAEALERLIPPTIEYSGVVSMPKGTSRRFHNKKIRLLEATHPIPSIKSVKATVAIMKAVRSATANSLVLCLISGGGSSLMALPATGLTLHDKVRTTHLLLKCGASIEKVNTVRKHLSSVKGGQLARAGNGARILSLIISDIVGNPIESIASGPTSPDPTTFRDALQILTEYGILQKVPTRAAIRLKQGILGRIPETPKPRDPMFEKVTNFILGDNSVACSAAIDKLNMNDKIRTYYLGSAWQGESRDTAANLTDMFLAVNRNLSEIRGFDLPCAFVWGGETTVTVHGKGKGGRNQEEALSALIKLKEKDGITVAFMGTDGVDGFSTAAGAIIDSIAYRVAESKKLSPEKYLKDNDSNSFFKKIGNSLLMTGPTGTNVNDIGIALVQTPCGNDLSGI